MSKELQKVAKHAPSNDCPCPEKYFVYMLMVTASAETSKGGKTIVRQ
jgi:hypothetical protein